MRPDVSVPVEPIGEKDVAMESFAHEQAAERQLQLLNAALAGKLTFGDGTEVDNVAGKWIAWTTSGGEDVLTHNLGVVPTGFLLVKPPEYGFICKSITTAWSTTTISVWCGEANQSCLMFVLIPPKDDL